MSEMTSIDVSADEQGCPFLWELTEQDLRISDHWSQRGLFTSRVIAQQVANIRVRDVGIWSASISDWRNYSAGLGEVDQIRWWSGEHSIVRVEGVLFGEHPVNYDFTGADWNNSAYTQLIEKVYINAFGQKSDEDIRRQRFVEHAAQLEAETGVSVDGDLL